MNQLTVEVEVPVTLTANGCVRPTGTDWGDAEVPVGVTVTPTGVELPPHPPTQAAKIIVAPICQALILNPPTIPARPKMTRLKLCKKSRKSSAKSNSSLERLPHCESESLLRLDQARRNMLNLLREQKIQLRHNLRLQNTGRQAVFLRLTQEKGAGRRGDSAA